MKGVIITAATVVALAAGCGSSPPPAVDPSAKGTTRSLAADVVVQELRVTRDTRRGPKACHPEDVGRLIVNLFATVNRGEADRVTDFFTSTLGWYSVTEGNSRNRERHFVAYKTTDLQTYFERRVAQNERMYLVEIDVAYERTRNLGHVAYNLRRTADDLTRYAATALGKGAIDCDTGRIYVWSMAQHREALGVGGDLCPGDPDPPAVAIVCARR